MCLLFIFFWWIFFMILFWRFSGDAKHKRDDKVFFLSFLLEQTTTEQGYKKKFIDSKVGSSFTRNKI